MTELLILAILLEGEFTIYKIKQKILSIFSLFSYPSFGSIYPALKKLEKRGCVSAKKKISQRGQRSSLYSIKPEGKEYFRELMTNSIDEKTFFSDRLANIKIMLLDLLQDENLRRQTIDSVKRYYEVQLLNLEETINALENSKEEDKNYFRIKLLRHHANRISDEIKLTEKL